MNNKLPSESYTSRTLCGQLIILEVWGEVGSITKMALGNRFCCLVKCFPRQCGYSNETVYCFFDFYNNYAPMLHLEELEHGWKCYLKAKAQRSDSFDSAFWNYLSGKRIKMLGRKGVVF